MQRLDEFVCKQSAQSSNHQIKRFNKRNQVRMFVLFVLYTKRSWVTVQLETKRSWVMLRNGSEGLFIRQKLASGKVPKL